jgi:hypothetical protein
MKGGGVDPQGSLAPTPHPLRGKAHQDPVSELRQLGSGREPRRRRELMLMEVLKLRAEEDDKS